MSASHGSARPARMGRIVCVSIAAVVCSAFAFTANASAAKTVPVTNTYMAFGDSLAFGYSDQLFNENLPEEAPTAFENGYANRYAAKLPKARGWRLVNMGCPGETSKSLIGNGSLAKSLGVEGEAPCAYHEAAGFPLHTEYGAPGTSQLEAGIGQYYAAAAAGRPVGVVTLNIGANDELHAIANAEALARANAEAAGAAKAGELLAEVAKKEGSAYEAGVEAGEAKAEALAAEVEAEKGSIYAGGLNAAAAAVGTKTVALATLWTTEWKSGYGYDCEGPGGAKGDETCVESIETAEEAGVEAFLEAIEDGKTVEEADVAGETKFKEVIVALAKTAAIESGVAEEAFETYVTKAIGIEATKAAEAAITAEITAIATEVAVEYGEEHGATEVKEWLEAHAVELFSGIVTNEAKTIGTLREIGYTGKVIVLGGYDPYGNVYGEGELLAGSTTLTKTLNQIEEAQLTKSPLNACFANPYSKFNPGKSNEPVKLQAYTNMANFGKTNGRADGPDIHPTPEGYKVMANVIKSACGN